ncbi:hypothetical protein M3Y98_01139200 [Aphelenchoides besseyi]|nr:hypothetical protein M3Y98_01139200 [Aphelenchoides besseyi]
MSKVEPVRQQHPTVTFASTVQPEKDCEFAAADPPDVILSAEMGLQQVWIIPILTFVFTLIAFITSYTIAVSLRHVSAIWPYISDGGAFAPESCIFGQLLNLSALFLAITVYLRHRQIVEFYWHHHQQTGRWRFFSCVLLWIGYASALGVSIVANFQESNVIFVHYFGAIMAFSSGVIYTWCQTVLSYNMNPKLARPVVSHARLGLCCCSTLFFVGFIVFGTILGKHPKTYTTNNQLELYKWTGLEDNYVEHMIGTISEWLLAICFQLYILSFAIELRHAYCHAPKLKLIAYLNGQDSAVSPDVFDCVLPAAICRKSMSSNDSGEVLGRSRQTNGNDTMNTLSTRISNDETASNISTASMNSIHQPEGVVVK